jgi:hypothetical protein
MAFLRDRRGGSYVNLSLTPFSMANNKVLRLKGVAMKVEASTIAKIQRGIQWNTQTFECSGPWNTGLD